MNVSLVIFKDKDERKEFSLERGKTIIGRKEDCDLRIPLAEISRKHAMIILEEKAVSIRDMGSANGTYVNNERVNEQELEAGDHIVIGPVVFTVKIDGQPEDVRPVHTQVKPRTKMREMAAVQKTSAKEEDTADKEDIFEGSGDPISALEALASTGDTAAFEMDLDLSDSFPAAEEEKKD